MLSQAVRQGAVFDGLLWMGIVLGAVALAAWTLLAIRKRFQSLGNNEPADFSLDQLRELRDRGELTLAEYEALRQNAIERVKNTVKTSASGNVIERGSRGGR